MSKKNDKKRIGAFNYKIEQLEPRMMMNADVVLDDFGDNISNVSTTVESALSEVDDLQLSGLGLDESLEPRFMMDASVDYETFTNAEHFQTEITEQLQNFETADLSNLGLNGAQVEASWGGILPPLGLYVARKTPIFIKIRTDFVPMNESDVKVKGPSPYSIKRLKPRFMVDALSIGILISKILITGV